MRAVVQRVLSASVKVDSQTVSHIKNGLLVYLGVMKDDSKKDADHIAGKISALRIFEDSDGKMNLSVSDKEYEVLLVSQFTICGNVIRGNRPSFGPAEAPESADKMYCYVADQLRALGISTSTGKFQAHMEINSINDGPVTILVDSAKTF